MAKSRDYQKKSRFFDRWYKFVRIIASMYAKKYPEIFPRGGKLPSGGNLILANHVTRIDYLIIGLYYEYQRLQFVAGENVFKNPALRIFAEKCMNVIVHLRGISSFNTIHEISKSLRRGENVMIFPTGTMTFSGKSERVADSIAKLAKISSCNLVLLRTEGGYFIQPRWGLTLRRGPLEISELVITKDELKKMSTGEIDGAINNHLYTDAYEKQEKRLISYKGKKLCKGLEACVYECPKCKEISGLKTTDTHIFCKCGFKAYYDEYGFLTDTEGKKYNISKLCDDQKDHLRKRYFDTEGTHHFLFEDFLSIKRLYHDGKREGEKKIRLKVYSDGIEYESQNDVGQIPFDIIDTVFVYMRNFLNVNFKDKDYGYELLGDFSTNALKYRDLFEIIKGEK